MIKKSHFIAVYFIVMIVLTSCGPPSQMATVPPTQPLPTKTQPVFVDPVQKNCVETIPIEQFSPVEKGVLLLFSVDPYVPYLADPLNNQKEELSSEPRMALYELLISPNRKLATVKISATEPSWQTTKLQIVDSAGTTQNEFTWKSDWAHIDAWLDNHRLLIAKNSDLKLGITNPTSILILDINTGQDVEIPSAYPDLNRVAITSWSLINHIYSPDFTRVLYLTSKVDPSYINYTSLFDLDNKKVLATLPIELGETSTPQWSPNGSQVLVSGLVAKPEEPSNDWRGKELFTIDRNGNIRQLTHFTDYYSGTVTIEKYTWSPDGQNIAFWFQTEEMSNPKLVILNVDSGEAIDHCISALSFHSAFPLIWSPTGKYLLFDMQESANAVPRTLLMNIAQNVVTQIGEDVVPVGWMVSADE